MKILIDTDVLLDVALKRMPHVTESAAVLRWVEAGNHAAIAWHSISNCAYLLKGNGRAFLSLLLGMVEVAEVATKDAHYALDLPMADLEDAMQVAAAQKFGAKYVITRNLPDYKNSPILGLSPKQFLARI
ncbi:MAG: type II toxin-antitoxin system VapC family toxin [Lentimonas sp.]